MTTENLTPNERCWLCPLYCFECECESGDLAEGIQIKSAPRKLKEFLNEHYTSEHQWDDPAIFDWVVSLPYRPDNSETDRLKRILAEYERASDVLYVFVTSCRLHHKGSITPGLLISVELQGSDLSIRDRFFPRLSKNGWSGEPRYELRQADITEINKLMGEIHTCCMSGGTTTLDGTLSRFNAAYYGGFEDRLIDQMIAFESLYLSKEQELKYRLALRTAFLLGGTQKTIRKTIFTNMQKAYKLRSNILHGTGLKNSERQELRKLISQTEEYLRQSIRRFLLLLSQGNSLKEIRDNLLDENILKNGRLLAIR